MKKDFSFSIVPQRTSYLHVSLSPILGSTIKAFLLKDTSLQSNQFTYRFLLLGHFIHAIPLLLFFMSKHIACVLFTP